MIFCNFKWFTSRRGKKELLLDYATDENGLVVVMPSESPEVLGARKHPELGWVIFHER
jgi:hypothetical protein